MNVVNVISANQKPVSTELKVLPHRAAVVELDSSSYI